MKTKSVISLLAISLTALGCAYSVAPQPMRAVKYFSSHKDPVPGRWAVVVDESTTKFSRDIKMSSMLCAANIYPIDPGDTIASSLHATLDTVFEKASRESTVPSVDAMRRNDLTGAVRISLDDFHPHLSCSQNFLAVNRTATIDMTFGVQVDGRNEKLSVFSASGDDSAEGDAGPSCDASVVIADAYKGALEESLQQMAERLSGSVKLRDAAR